MDKPLYRIAVVTPNSLEGLGLISILRRIMPQADYCMFASHDQLISDANATAFVHYFIDSRTLMSHLSFYQPLQARTMVMVSTEITSHIPPTFKQFSTHTDEASLIKDLLSRMQSAHSHHHTAPHPITVSPLTAREKDVLRLIVKGYINKEIADMLHVETTTIITHRKNLTQKLGTRSVGGLTIYAVMHGIVKVEEI